MIKKLLLASALVYAGTAWAQNFTDPPEGVINMEAYPSGAGCVSLHFTQDACSVFRQSGAKATLYRDGSPLKTIQASDASSAYMYDGFDKVTNGFDATLDFYHSTLESQNPATLPGIYEIKVDEGFFIYDSGDKVEAFVGEWTIKGVNYTLTPAKGSKLESISTITLTFDKMKSVSFTDNTTTITQVVDGETVVQVQHAVSLVARSSDTLVIPEVSCEGNTVTFTFDPAVDEVGTFYFTIKAGCLELTSEEGTASKNGIIETVYYVEKPQARPEIYPAEGTVQKFEPFEVGSVFTYFKLTCDQEVGYALMQAPRIEPIDGSAGPSKAFHVVKNTANSKEILLESQYASERTADNVYAPADGTYRLRVPASSWQYKEGAVKNEMMEYIYQIKADESGVEAVVIGRDTLDVYTPTGICVGRGLSSDAFQELPKGIYIVNGHKVAKR